MLNLLFGYVTNIDANGRAAVKLPELDDWVTDFLPVIKSKSRQDKEENPLDMDEEVAVIFDDEKQQGVILGAINTDSSPLALFDRNKAYYTFSDGSHFEYDKATHKASADVKGEVELKATKTTHIGDLYVNGNIYCSKDVSDKKGTMQAMRDIFDPHAHKDGNNGALTTAPTTKMG